MWFQMSISPLSKNPYQVPIPKDGPCLIPACLTLFLIILFLVYCLLISFLNRTIIQHSLKWFIHYHEEKDVVFIYLFFTNELVLSTFDFEFYFYNRNYEIILFISYCKLVSWSFQIAIILFVYNFQQSINSKGII